VGRLFVLAAAFTAFAGCKFGAQPEPVAEPHGQQKKTPPPKDGGARPDAAVGAAARTDAAAEAAPRPDAAAGAAPGPDAAVGTAVRTDAAAEAAARTDAAADAAARPAAPDASPTPARAPVRFAVIGDYGRDGEGEASVAALVRSWKVDFVITTGDNNYNDGEASTIDANVGKHYQEFIGNYTGAYGPGSPVNRFWPTPGNHDWRAPDLKPYRDYFTLPGNERYYDVDAGLVHLFALSSDGDEPDGITETSTQAGWLKQRLAASRSCFDLVYFHHAPYSSGKHGGTAELRWPFAAWGADVVMAGHDHHYERLEASGIPYFVVGIGEGARDIPSQVPESLFRYNGDAGALLVTATGTGITYELWNVSGDKIDSFTTRKTCP
jgi:hypothetical protein